MQRSVVVALLLLLAAIAGSTWWLLRGEPPPPAPIDAPSATTPDGPGDLAATSALTAAGSPAATAREAMPGRRDEALDDPEIRAGLCGFKGRVVTHQKVPVADCGVRIYRGALDSVLPADFDLFAPEPSYTPDYIAGEVKTASDGTWQLTGVWPRAFYLLFAGIGTDAPTHQILTRTPSPGEMVDLGDIVLPDAGVITGTVVDDNGDPLAGALVRAADLPGTLAAFFPFERFDPKGALLVREPDFPQRVVTFPSWVERAFEQLPIPTAHSGTDGRFRLVGVVPGSNLLATTASGFLSDVKPSVPVRAGQEKNVGTIRMKRGEELNGRVLDTAGKPIAEAEVLAGSTLSVAPVDLAQKLGRSDAEGRFTGQGFAPGRVTVAARRGPGHQWTLAEPQSILGDVVVTLPATFACDVTVTGADGKPATTVRFKLLQGRAGNGAAEMHLLGLVPAVDLRDRQRAVAEGRWKIENLTPGSYTLLADAPGLATSVSTFDVTTADTAVTLALTLPKLFTVKVVDPQDKPIRNAAIFAQGRGGERTVDMPVRCGRTGADGTKVVDQIRADTLRVSADHPKWGVVHGEVKAGETVTLRMEPPGALRGVLFENGKPPEAGRFTVALERRNGNGPRGPIETVPALLTPGLDGVFVASALQPGQYRVQVIKSLDALRSPGGVMALAQEMFMARNLPAQTVDVVSGQTAQVQLEAGEKPIEGPTARLQGSLLVDGKVGSGYIVTANARERRFSARVDERGRFDLGTVPAAELWVAIMGGGDGMMFGGDNNLWSANVKLVEGEARELTIEVLTASIAGVCVDTAGTPLEGIRVQGQGVLKGDERRNNVWISAVSNAQGEFSFPRVAEGTWTLTVQGGRRGRGGAVRGKVEGLVVTGGAPVTGVRLEALPAVTVSGRVDLATFGTKRLQWAWVAVHQLRDEDPPEAEGRQITGFGIDRTSGTFRTEELAAGRYRFKLHAGLGDDENGEYPLETLVVPPAGLADVVLRPGPRIRR